MPTNFSAEFIEKYTKVILLILYSHYIVFGKKKKEVHNQRNVPSRVFPPSGENLAATIKNLYLFDVYGLYRNTSDSRWAIPPDNFVVETPADKLFSDNSLYVLSGVKKDDFENKIFSRTRDSDISSYNTLQTSKLLHQTIPNTKLSAVSIGGLVVRYSQNALVDISFELDEDVSKLNEIIKARHTEINDTLLKLLENDKIYLYNTGVAGQTPLEFPYKVTDNKSNAGFLSLYLLCKGLDEVLTENIYLSAIVAYILYLAENNNLSTAPINIQYIALMFALSIVVLLPYNIDLLDGIFKDCKLLDIILEKSLIFNQYSATNNSQSRRSAEYRRKSNLSKHSQADDDKLKKIIHDLFDLLDFENKILVDLVKSFGINLPKPSFLLMKTRTNIGDFTVYDTSGEFRTLLSPAKIGYPYAELETNNLVKPALQNAAWLLPANVAAGRPFGRLCSWGQFPNYGIAVGAPARDANIEDNLFDNTAGELVNFKFYAGPIFRYYGKSEYQFCANLYAVDDSRDPNENILNIIKNDMTAGANLYNNANFNILPPQYNTPGVTALRQTIGGIPCYVNSLFAMESPYLVYYENEGNTTFLEFEKYKNSLKGSLYYKILTTMFDLNEEDFTTHLSTAAKFQALYGSPIPNSYYGFPTLQRYLNIGDSNNSFSLLILSKDLVYADFYAGYISDSIAGGTDLLTTAPLNTDTTIKARTNEKYVSCSSFILGNPFALTYFLKTANLTKGFSNKCSKFYPTKKSITKPDKKTEEANTLKVNFKKVLLFRYIKEHLRTNNNIKKYFPYISDYHDKFGPITPYYSIEGLPKIVNDGTLVLPTRPTWSVYYDTEAKELACYRTGDRDRTKMTISEAHIKECRDINISSSDSNNCISLYDLVKNPTIEIEYIIDKLAELLPSKITQIENINPMHAFIILKKIKFPTEITSKGKKTEQKYLEDTDKILKNNSKLASIGPNSSADQTEKNVFDYLVKLAKYLNNNYKQFLNSQALKLEAESGRDPTYINEELVRKDIYEYITSVYQKQSKKSNVRAIIPLQRPIIAQPVPPMLPPPILVGGGSTIPEQLINYHFTNLNSTLQSIRKLEQNAPLNGNLIPILQPDLMTTQHGGEVDEDGNLIYDIGTYQPEDFEEKLIEGYPTVLYDRYSTIINNIKKRFAALKIDISEDVYTKIDQNLDALKKTEEYTVFYSNQLLRYWHQINITPETQIGVDFDRINKIAKHYYETREKAMGIENTVAKTISYFARLEARELARENQSIITESI